MSFRLPGFASKPRWTIAVIGLFVALSGCGGSEGGSGDFTQKFEPPPAVEGAKSAPPVVSEKPKSRREEIDEDRAAAKAAQQKKGKGKAR